MLRDGFAYWVSIGSSAACSNNTINFAPFGRRTQAKACAGYHGALHAKRRGLAPSQLIDISINSDTIICMAKIQDILSQMRESPKSIKFNDLCKVCDAYFGEPRQSASSHRVYRTPWKGDPRVNIQNAKGMSKAYQVKQVLQAVERLEVQNGKKY